MIINATAVTFRNALCHDLLHPPYINHITEPSISTVPSIMSIMPYPPSYYAFIKTLQLSFRSPHEGYARKKHLAVIRTNPDYAVLQTIFRPVNFFSTFSKLSYRRVRFWAQPKWSTNICTTHHSTIIYFSEIFRVGWIFAIPSPYLLRGYKIFKLITFSTKSASRIYISLQSLSTIIDPTSKKCFPKP